jgi:hypothetical protein
VGLAAKFVTNGFLERLSSEIASMPDVVVRRQAGES